MSGALGKVSTYIFLETLGINGQFLVCSEIMAYFEYIIGNIE
jgi:hypothetical protein